MYYNRIYFNSDVMRNPDILNGIQDDIINIIIPHLAEYGFEFTFEKHTYAVNEFPLISNISAIEDIIDEMGKAINYTLDIEFAEYYNWIEKKDWTANGKKLFGAEDLNRWCNNLVFLEAYEKPIPYNWVEYKTLSQGSGSIGNTSVVLKNGDDVYSPSYNMSSLYSEVLTHKITKADIELDSIEELNDETITNYDNALCFMYGSYIYIFGGMTTTFFKNSEASGVYLCIAPHRYYKFNIETNEWVKEDGKIKKYYCPYTFENNISDVIFYDGKLIFSYVDVDEENIPEPEELNSTSLEDYENSRPEKYYPRGNVGTLKFLEFNPSTDAWVEKEWDNLSIISGYDNYPYTLSYNKMTTATERTIYFSTTRIVNDEEQSWLYKIENDNVSVVSAELPGSPLKMFFYEKYIYMICNKVGEFTGAVYRYNILTGKIELMFEGYSGFGYTKKYTTSYYMDNGELYCIRDTKIYRLERE